MKTITEKSEIKAMFANFEAGRDGAQPTNRLISGASSAMDPQEWRERGILDGVDVAIYYMFSQDEASDEDASNYPWDAEHIDRIVLAEEDDDASDL